MNQISKSELKNFSKNHIIRQHFIVLRKGAYFFNCKTYRKINTFRPAKFSWPTQIWNFKTLTYMMLPLWNISKFQSVSDGQTWHSWVHKSLSIKHIQLLQNRKKLKTTTTTTTLIPHLSRVYRLIVQYQIFVSFCYKFYTEVLFCILSFYKGLIKKVINA